MSLERLTKSISLWQDSWGRVRGEEIWINKIWVRECCVYIYIYNYTVINWILKWTRQSSEKNVKMLKVAQDRKIITLKETEMESSPF